MHRSDSRVQNFNAEVGLKFQLYNGLFTALPFHKIENTGVLLSVFLSECEDGFGKKKSPQKIVEQFFKKHTNYDTVADQQNLLFRFVQYAERQVVLFDAMEDAAFSLVNDLNGPGTLKDLMAEAEQTGKEEELKRILEDFSVTIVLTAHPTQFYPGSVLGILNDLSKALKADQASKVNQYLQQLGKTAFLKKQKPTPYDEAVSLIWFLENVFYNAIGNISNSLQSYIAEKTLLKNPVVKMGFWPGGDRDGNPFVNAQTTIEVAAALRGSILKCYYLDLRRLRRRLTFDGIEVPLAMLEQKLYHSIFLHEETDEITQSNILKTLHEIREVLVAKHRSIFLPLLQSFIHKVEVFGLHFATLDIRQDSSIHEVMYQQLETDGLLPANFAEKTRAGDTSIFSKIKKLRSGYSFENATVQDCLNVVHAIKQIQNANGEQGCNRYIISHSTSAASVLQVMGIFIMAGYDKSNIPVDFVPLFETIDDLHNAAESMEALYTDPMYQQHLAQRKNKQTIMVGFSDGTKDGGYLMANWGIYTAKEALSSISKKYNIDVVFFDGRGGPPARGGGKSHRFYASMGNNIANEEIQLTIQGQTISTNFGTPEAARFNMEQLIHAGISNKLVPNRRSTLTDEESALLQDLSEKSFECYQGLKLHPSFLKYLQYASPLEFYGQTNIGSRPAKRGKSSKLTLNDLRAIPFVGAWSQLKQNVTGYYGVGTALRYAEENGQLQDCIALYKNSLFFKTMLDNCEMAMKKCFFPLTAHLSKDPVYGVFWNMIYDEYELTRKYLKIVTGNEELMADYPVDQLSIQMRERIMLPLLTIQQYAIAKYRDQAKTSDEKKWKENFGKLVMRCSFGIINAGRNSA